MKVHVSGRNGDTASVLKRSDGYWVYIKQALFGPYETIDLLKSSPFSGNTATWQFRASQSGGEILVVNGVSYGPFDHVWTPNFSNDGNHWGALIKDADQFAVIVDGRKTKFYDRIFSYVMTDPPSLDEHTPCTAPYFYGTSNRWVAIAARNEDASAGRAAEFHILSGNGEGLSFDIVDILSADPDNLGYGNVSYPQYLTANGECFAIGTHRTNTGENENYLWVNETVHGPYDLKLHSPSFRADTNMSDDGSNWAFPGTDKIYTKDRVFSFTGASGPAISSSGTAVSFIFYQDDGQYIYANGQQLGPFVNALGVSFSSNGQHWIASGQGDDSFIHFTSDRGIVYGPYRRQADIFYRNDNWISMIYDENEEGHVVYNGAKIAGPFTNMLADLSSHRRNDQAWSMTGYKDDQATLVINGQIRYQRSGVRNEGWKNLSVSKDGSHWALLSINTNHTLSFVDNGVAVDGLAFPQTLRVISSEAIDRNALVSTFVDRENFLINGTTFGPYAKNTTNIVYGSNGSSWAASAKSESGAAKLILSGAAPVEYERIEEMKGVQGADAVIYNGFRENRWFPGINRTALGTYNQASITSATDGTSTIYLAVNEGDRKVKTYKVAIQR